MTISVALCTYNGEKYLKDQLESILTQNTSITELVICDDRSTDNTVTIIKEFQLKYPEIIKLHINEINIGVVKNFEKAINHCTGEIIFLSDQDDIWMETKTTECVAYFNTHRSMLGCFTDAELINNENELQNKTLWSSILFDSSINGPGILKYLVQYRNMITGACLALRREALQYVMPIPAFGKMLHDEWIGFKLAALNALGKIDQPLIKYRVHSTQQTGLPLENYNENYFKIRSAIFKNDFSQYPLYHYFHWARKLNLAPELRKNFNIPELYFKEIKEHRLKSLEFYFSGRSFFSKKTELIKWFIKGNKYITITDILSI